MITFEVVWEYLELRIKMFWWSLVLLVYRFKMINLYCIIICFYGIGISFWIKASMTVRVRVIHQILLFHTSDVIGDLYNPIVFACTLSTCLGLNICTQ